MSKGKERKRKREEKGREGETSDDTTKCRSVSLGRKGGANGGYGRKKKKGNLDTKYVAGSACIKNI